MQWFIKFAELTIIDDFTEYNLGLSHVCIILRAANNCSIILLLSCVNLWKYLLYLNMQSCLLRKRSFLCRFTVLQGLWNKSCTQYQQLRTVQALEVVFLNQHWFLKLVWQNWKVVKYSIAVEKNLHLKNILDATEDGGRRQ